LKILWVHWGQGLCTITVPGGGGVKIEIRYP
jgi:hypothetical protein